ncbi:MAG: hypothetical protein ACI82I_003222 [Gammaproteobacteria bacterium]
MLCELKRSAISTFRPEFRGRWKVVKNIFDDDDYVSIKVTGVYAPFASSGVMLEFYVGTPQDNHNECLPDGMTYDGGPLLEPESYSSNPNAGVFYDWLNANSDQTFMTNPDISIDLRLSSDDDTITDFEVGTDRLKISGLTSADVRFSTVGADTLVSLSTGDTILVENTTIAQLNSFSDFDFV